MSTFLDDRETIGTREAATLARVSEQTIRNYKASGIVDGFRNPVNGRREIFKDDVLALRRR